MAKSRYSEEYIASIKAGTGQLPADKGQATYVKRLARNYEPGVSRSQLRGHARTNKGEKPLSVVKYEKGTGPAPKQKPTLSKSGKSGRKNLGRHITKQYDQQGNVRRTRVNVRSGETFVKDLGRVNDKQGVIIHLIGKDGRVLKAVGSGKNHTSNAGDLKRRIADNIAKGASPTDAVLDAIGDSFSLYDEDGNYVDSMDLDFTNIIMYAE